MLLQRQDGEVGAFALVRVQVRTVEVGYAVDRKTQGRLAGIIGNLELAIEAAQDHADSRVGVEDGGGIGEAVELVGEIVDRIGGSGRVFDADVVVQEVAGDVPID